MKMISSTIRLRLVLICIILGTIPAVVVGMFSYYNAAGTVQKKVDEGNERVLQQIKMSVEQLLYTADRIMFQFIESPTIKSSMTVDMKGNEFEAFANTESVINNLPTIGMGVTDISFANFDKGWVINNSGIRKLEGFDRQDEYREYLKVTGSSFWADELSIKKSGDFQPASGARGVSLVKKFPIFITNPSCIAVLRIPYASLSGLVSVNDRLGEVIIIGEDGCVVAHNDQNMWGTDLSAAEYVKRIKSIDKMKGNITLPIDHKDYSVSFLKSEYNGWTYISIVSLNNLTVESKAIGWFTLLACLLVIVAVNIMAFIISGRMYKPIRKLYNLVTGIPEGMAVREKQDEFGLIEARVNFLLKDQETLKNQVYSQVEQLKEFFVLKLILGEVDRALIESRIKLYNYPPLPACMGVFVTRIDRIEGTRYKENDTDLMLFAINNIISEAFEEVIVLKTVVIDEYQVNIIGSNEWTEKEFKNSAYSIAERMQEIILKNLEFTVSIGISGLIHDYSEIHRGYEEGIEALKHQIMLGYNAIIFVQDIKKNSASRSIFPSDLERELLDSVRLCDAAKSKELLHQFVDRLFKLEISRHEYQIYLVRLVTDLVFVLKESGDSYNVILRDDKSLFDKLFQLKASSEVESWLNKALIEPIIEYLEAAEESQYKKIVDEILKIIHEEYDTEITLEECAARMNYHSSYIRRILKKEAGIVFSEYLIQFRMDMAKKWLTETDMKVSDIAEKLKYKNSENFIRGFKKIVGMTPGQYRETIK